MSKRTIVFIHGLWIHSDAWKPWIEFFKNNGYNAVSPPWPGDGVDVASSRANSSSIANRGVVEVANAYAKIINTFPEPPIVIGHSFGGLITQVILGRGIAAAGIAIDPAPIKGVWQLPFSALKSALPVLGNPFNLKKAVSLTYGQFKYAFANALSDQEAKDLYDRWVIPAPARPLFQAAFSTLNPNAETKVNTKNLQRGPLLITGGDKDHIAPPILGKASAAKYPKSVITDFKLFENRGHSLAMDNGWREIAEYSLSWLNSKGF